MPIATRASQFAELLNRFLSLDAERFFLNAPAFSEFDGPNVPEVCAQLAFLRATYEPMLAANQLTTLSFGVVSQLQSSLASATGAFEQLLRSQDQGSYQSFSQQLDTFIQHTSMFGVPYVAAGGAHLESTRAALQVELERARKNNEDVDELRASVHNLITPAVAGSLSTSFSARRDILMRGRIAWLLAAIALGVFSGWATYDLANALASEMLSTSASTGESITSIWVVVALRTIVLIPIYAAFGFTFAQYRKEREFEEEYAHKAAVAHSLPNYGDLARDANVRDAIVTAATGVIFTSPGEQARKAERSSAMLGEFRELVDALAKAAGK